MASTMFRKLQVVRLSADFRAAVNVVQCPLTQPEAGQVLVRSKFVGVNASDINLTAGRAYTDGKVPFDVGFEALGVVEQVGAGVQSLKKGQAVLFMGTSAFSEYVYGSEKTLLPVPDLKPEFLLSLACGLTAAIGLDEGARVKKGETVLITAAAGGTGHMAVQWAKRAGAFVIGTTSTDQKADYLRSIGVDHVINYREQDLESVLKTEYPRGVDVIWETIGGKVFETLVQRLAIGGRLILIGGIAGYKTVGIPAVDMNGLPAKLLMSSQSLVGFNVLNSRHLYPKYWSTLVQLIASREIQVKVDMGQSTSAGKFCGLEDVIRAVEYLHGGHNEGKVVVQMD